MSFAGSCRFSSCWPACCWSCSPGWPGLSGLERLQRVNALKNVLSLVINTVALAAFGIFGPVAWDAVLVIALASLLGGYGGAKVANRIPATALRVGVVIYGVTVATVLLVRG